MDYDTLGEIITNLKSKRITRKGRMKLKSAKERDKARGFNKGLDIAIKLLEGGEIDE